MLAGFTVGLTEIPQGIAYAIVAGTFPNSDCSFWQNKSFLYANFYDNYEKLLKLVLCKANFQKWISVSF